MKYIFLLFFLIFSCKDKQTSPGKMLDKKAEKQTNKKEYPIPSNLKIEKQEEVDFDDDEVKEVIITAADSDANNTYEFWYKDDQLIYQFKYPWGSINKKWLINLDDDKEKEIVRIQGYEDGVDYVIYDISEKQQIPILYFNPVLEDSRYPNQYMWAYPNDIKDLIVNKNKEIQVSLNNSYQRKDDHTKPENQKEFPFIFFKGQTSQPDMKLSSINKPEFQTVRFIIDKVRISTENATTPIDKTITQKWIGTYKVKFLRMKEESGDPRGWGFIILSIEQNSAKLQLDSYIENLKKDLIVVKATSDKIILADKDNKNSTFTIIKKNEKYMLESLYMDKLLGEKNSYEIEKN